MADGPVLRSKSFGIIDRPPQLETGTGIVIIRRAWKAQTLLRLVRPRGD